MQKKVKGRLSRIVYFYLAVVFAVCVAVQVFFAGIALFVDPAKWETHKIFIRIFEFIPIIMLIFSFTGKLPKSLRWLSFILFLLVMGMYATANLTRSIPIAGAFHPVVALIMFWIAAKIIPASWRLAYKSD